MEAKNIISQPKENLEKEVIQEAMMENAYLFKVLNPQAIKSLTEGW